MSDWKNPGCTLGDAGTASPAAGADSQKVVVLTPKDKDACFPDPTHAQLARPPECPNVLTFNDFAGHFHARRWGVRLEAKSASVVVNEQFRPMSRRPGHDALASAWAGHGAGAEPGLRHGAASRRRRLHRKRDRQRHGRRALSSQ